MSRKKPDRWCKCGKPCAYYGTVGGYSVACTDCNARNAERQRKQRRLAKLKARVK